MADTKLISPGIPNYTLKRNLRLNDKYISNDGGDEGVRVADNGTVTCSGNVTIGLNCTSVGYFTDEDDAKVTMSRLITDASATAVGGFQFKGETDGGAGAYTNLIPEQPAGPRFITLPDATGTVLVTPSGGANIHSSGNIALNGEYISNDGGDEGIRITDAGLVGIGVADPDTTLEIYKVGTQLKLSGSSEDYATFAVAADGALTITTEDASASEGDIILVPNGLSATAVFSSTGMALNTAGETTMLLNSGSSSIRLFSLLDTDDYVTFTGTTNGALSIITHDDVGNEGDITIIADGYVSLQSTSGENITLNSDGDIILDAGGHVEFDGCGVGFDQEEEDFSDDTLKGTGGTHDTQVDFRIGNKIYLQMTASMDQINLIFPAVSGNFLLLIRSDGDWAIGDWKVWESDLTEATVADVAWPGGTQPDNTASGRDIFSFYWDADNQQAYGVASLAFALPS
jgi:hypothetical protein